MKLFLCDVLTKHGGSSRLVLADTKDLAEIRVRRELEEEMFVYGVYASEVTEVDGYEISLNKK